MPIINIDMIEGRTLDQKRNLVKSVTQAVCNSIDTVPESVQIKLTEIKNENYSISGNLIADYK